MSDWFENEGVEFMFGGTVVDEQPAEWPGITRSTLQIHRVFKGDVPRRFVVYGIGDIDGVPKLTYGNRYVAAATTLRLQDPYWRRQGLPDSTVMVLGCSAYKLGRYGTKAFKRYIGDGRPPPL